MSRLPLLACLSLASLLPFVAGAQEMTDPATLVARADANHDGMISRDEFLAARAARFDRMDRNHDGYLTDADARGLPGRAARMFPLMLRMADSDNDGRISREEFNAMPARGFDRMDSNGDGMLDRDELAHAAQQFRSRHAN